MTLARCHFALCVALFAASSDAQERKPVVVIGGEDDRGVAIGVIQDVAVLPRILVVLEGAKPFLRVFNHSGKLLQTLGQEGNGPGEFRYPVAVTYDSARREVLVTDRLPARVTRYAVTDTLAFHGVMTSSVTELYGACAINGHIYALGTFGDGMIHELSLDPARIDPVRSIGIRKSTHPQSEAPPIKMRVTWGRMTCDENQHRILIANGLGDLHTIDVTTGAQTFARINGYVTINIRANEKGGMSTGYPAEGYWHNALAFIREGDGMVLVLGVRKPTGEVAPRTAIIGYATLGLTSRGAGTSIVPRVWQPLGRSGAMSICSVQDPYPTIAYFQQPRCP